VHNRTGEGVASVTIVGPTNDIRPRVDELSEVLLEHINNWERRAPIAREAI